MAEVEEIHVGDVGTRLEGVVKDGGDVVDLTTSTGIVMRLQKPDDSRVDHPATIDDALNGAVHYTTTPGDIDIPGSWLQQLIVNFPSGVIFNSDIESFEVFENIPEP